MSQERLDLPQGKAEVSFLALGASTDANEPHRRTDRKRKGYHRGGSLLLNNNPVITVVLADFNAGQTHELRCFMIMGDLLDAALPVKPHKCMCTLHLL